MIANHGLLECIVDGRKRTYCIALAVAPMDEASPELYIHYAGLDRQFCLHRVNPRKGTAAAQDDPSKSTMFVLQLILCSSPTYDVQSLRTRPRCPAGS